MDSGPHTRIFRAEKMLVLALTTAFFLTGGLSVVFAQTYVFMRGGHTEDLRVVVGFERDAAPPDVAGYQREWGTNGSAGSANAATAASGAPTTTATAAAATAALNPEARRELLAREILEKARQFISGMIFGYSFEYVPGDVARGVAERFEMAPLRLIDWGSPGLVVEVYRYDDAGGQYSFRYTMSESERRLRIAWSSVAIGDAAGTGSAAVVGPADPVGLAVEDASRAALREYARGATRVKPASIRGSFVFADAPAVRMDQGRLVAQVRVRVQIDRIRDYVVF